MTNTNINEAIDTGDVPDFISDEVRNQIENMGIGFEDLMPMSENEQSYLEAVASERYKEIIQEVETVLGRRVTAGQLPTLFGDMLGVIKDISVMEKDHKEQLEALALQVVFELPEFEFIKELYEEGNIDIDIELLTHAFKAEGFKNRSEVESKYEGLTQAEVDNLEIFDALNGLDEQVMKRKLANALIQGNALFKGKLYKMVESELNGIDTNLSKKYAYFLAVSELSFWVHGEPPVPAEDVPMSGTEQVEIDEKGENHKIIVRASNFPILIHELVKGFMEFVSHGAIEGGKDVQKYAIEQSDTFQDEGTGLRMGNKLWRKFQELVDIKDQKLILPIYQRLLTKSKEIIQSVFEGGDYAKQIIRDIADELKQEQKEHGNE